MYQSLGLDNPTEPLNINFQLNRAKRRISYKNRIKGIFYVKLDVFLFFLLLFFFIESMTDIYGLHKYVKHLNDLLLIFNAF